MATPIQRMNTVLSGLLDREVTDNALLLRVGNAYDHSFGDGTTLTNTQKANLVLRKIRESIKQIVLDSENSKIASQAVIQAKNSIDLGSE